jgi:AcrR family transcriptional regulator
VTAPIKPRRGRPKSQPDTIRREAIARRAAEMFASQGFAGTTTEDVAATCGISKQTLYRLFPSKTALFASVVDHHRQEMLDFGDTRGMDDATALERIFRVDIEPEADIARIRLVRVVVAESSDHPELGEVMMQYGGGKARAELGAWLAARGLLGPEEDVDPELQADILLNMIFGAVLAKEMGDLSFPGGERRRAYMRQCIRVFLQGARAR